MDAYHWKRMWRICQQGGTHLLWLGAMSHHEDTLVFLPGVECKRVQRHRRSSTTSIPSNHPVFAQLRVADRTQLVGAFGVLLWVSLLGPLTALGHRSQTHRRSHPYTDTSPVVCHTMTGQNSIPGGHAVVLKFQDQKTTS